jgi:hypothetical protein
MVDKLETTVDPRPVFIDADYCHTCSEVGMIHCSDPINCGGTPPGIGYRWRSRAEGKPGWVLRNPVQQTA